MTERETMREKLVELLEDGDNPVWGWFPNNATMLLLADHLIANDVTIQEKAKWVWNENAMDWGLGGWICGRCHRKNDNIPATPDVYPLAWVGSNFCPNCGAKMKEAEDDYKGIAGRNPEDGA